MIKRLVFGAAAGALVLAPLSARADWYINPEFNSGWSGSENASTLEGHVGYESGSFYIQGGPAYATSEGDSDLGVSGKTGVSLPVSEVANLYGEVSFSKFDDADAGYGLKLGGKYKF